MRREPPPAAGIVPAETLEECVSKKNEVLGNSCPIPAARFNPLGAGRINTQSPVKTPTHCGGNSVAAYPEYSL